MDWHLIVAHNGQILSLGFLSGSLEPPVLNSASRAERLRPLPQLGHAKYQSVLLSKHTRFVDDDSSKSSSRENLKACLV
jgi:hypothetical protein